MSSHLPTCRRGEGFATIAELDTDDGIIRGQAVPYGKLVELAPGLFEMFEPGAFKRQLKDPSRVKVCLEHGQVIGRVEELHETDAGLQFTGSISTSADIPEARRARAMLADQLVDELSVGFNTVSGGSRTEQLEGGQTLIRHSRARLLEVSIVPWGVYGRDATLARSVLHDPAERAADVERTRRIAEARAYAQAYAAGQK